MTAKRDLKRRVRDRQERTGESYTTALRHVLDQRAAPASVPVPVLEFIDISEVGAALGLQCRVKLAPTLADRVDAAAALRKLLAALAVTLHDPAFNLMRAVLLAGANPPGRPLQLVPARRFRDRVRSGIGGISEHGQLLALTVDGRRGAELVVFALWLSTLPYVQKPPWLCVTSADGTLGDVGDRMLLWR